MAVLATGVLGWLLYYWLGRQKLETQHLIITSLIVLALGVLVILTLTGGLHWLAALGAGSFFLLRRLFPLLQYLPLANKLWQRRTSKDGTARPSMLETEWLVVHIDYQAMALSGSVRKGMYQGQQLNQMSATDLQALHQELAQDSASQGLLELYMQQTGRHSHHRTTSSTSSGAMSVADAMKILGLEGKPSREDIIATHKKIIQRLHPDRGGSDHLATLVNTARDVLIKAL